MSFASDLDAKAVERALSGRVAGSRVLHLETVGSTMDVAREEAEAGAAEGLVVIAEEQTKGRGRFNRAWISPRGKNLSFSVVLRPEMRLLPQVNMAATLAVHRTVEGFTGRNATIKWPNDVRIGGRKASGVLIESHDSSGGTQPFTIVGIGVNVNFDPSAHEEIADRATSIFAETGVEANRGEVLTLLLTSLDELYVRVARGESLRKSWARELDTLGRMVKLSWRNEVVEGRAVDVDEEGQLVIERIDGSMFRASAGEVTSQI